MMSVSDFAVFMIIVFYPTWYTNMLKSQCLSAFLAESESSS